jgi:hypothetical protein
MKTHTCQMTKTTSRTHNNQPVSRTNIGIQNRLYSIISNHSPSSRGRTKRKTCLISRQPRTKDWAHNLRIYIIRKNRQIIRIERNILLKAAILMVEMVGTLNAVLLRTGKTKLAPPTDAARKPDPH